MSHDDFAFEPVRGLPERLPPGEKMLWQGAPDWKAIAKTVFHIRFIAAYFAVMVGWQVVTAFYDGQPFVEAAMGVVWMTALAGLCCGILAFLAWAIARTTVYTLTSERLVMRIGVALPMTLNIPYSKIASAAAAVGPDGIGNIPLTLVSSEKIGYAVLWPHARPWRMKRAEPMLRCIPNASEVAGLVSRALATAASRPDARTVTAPSAEVHALRPASAGSNEDVSEKQRIAKIA